MQKNPTHCSHSTSDLLYSSHNIHFTISYCCANIHKYDDSYLRKTAINKKIPYITTISAALASAKGIKAVLTKETATLKSLQEYHKSLD